MSPSPPRAVSPPPRAADQFTYIVGAGGHGPQPDRRPDRRRHPGDDHGHGLHRGHRGRLRDDGGDQRHRGEQHLDHRRQPRRDRGRGRHRHHAWRQVRYLVRRPVHLSRGADGHGHQPERGPAAGGTLVTITGTELHRRHRGRLRHRGGDQCHRRQQHLDHRRPPRRAPGSWTSPSPLRVASRPPRPPTSSPTSRRRPVTGVSPTRGPAAGGTW